MTVYQLHSHPEQSGKKGSLQDFVESLKSISPQMVLGLGTLWALVQSIMCTSPDLFFLGEQGTETGILAPEHFFFFIALTIGFVFVSLFFGIAGEKAATLVWDVRFLALTSATVFLGLLVLFLAKTFLIAPLFYVGAILCSSGVAAIVLLWGDFYAHHELTAITVNALLGIILGFIIHEFVSLTQQQGIVDALYCLLAIYQFFPLYNASKKIRIPKVKLKKALKEGSLGVNKNNERETHGAALDNPTEQDFVLDVPTKSTLKVKRKTFAIAIGVPSFLFGFALGPLSVMALSTIGVGVSIANQMVLAIIACVIVTIITMAAYFFRERELDTFYRSFIPVIALSMLLVPYLFAIYPHAAISLIFVSYLAFELTLWIEFSEISNRYRISTLLTFGFGRGFLSIGMQFGIIVALLLGQGNLIGQNDFAVFSFMIVALFFGYLFFPRERAIRHMAVLENTRHIYAGSESDAEKKVGRFFQACNQIADRHLLSRRETEVFFLLAKGRNASFIADKLFISMGTVHTHSWRIYRKLNVHSQQELMNLVSPPSPGAARKTDDK